MSYGNGINVASGFDLGAKSPLDSRNVAETIAERDENVTNNRAYEGMIVYVKENKTTYQYVNNEWIIFGSNTSSDNVYTKEEINEIKRILEEKDIELSQKIDQINEYLANSGGSGGANVYIGEEPPQDTSMIWVDSSTPYTLEPNTYENRLKNNYVMMLNNSYGKISTIESGLTSLQNAIDKITSPDNAQKVTDFNIELNIMIDDCNLLKDKLTKSKTSIINNSLSSSLKAEAKKVQKEVKTFIYSLYDLKHQIMLVIDSERITIVIPEEPENPDKPPVTTVDNCLLTENGLTLLTEDGKVLLVDGIEDGNSTEILTDAILTELGLTLLTENGKQILKG